MAESNREFDAYPMIRLLSEALADSSKALGDKEGSEYLIRAASLCLLHDTPEGHDRAAVHLARAWERYPTTRILELILPLFDAKELSDMPDGILVAMAELGESTQRVQSLRLLTHRSLAGNNTRDAHRYLTSWLQLAPEDTQALNLQAELKDVLETGAEETELKADSDADAAETSTEIAVVSGDIEEPETDTTTVGSPRPDGSADEVIQWIRDTLPEASVARRAMLRRSLITLLRESGADANAMYEALSADIEPPTEISVILEEADALIADGEWESAAAHLEASVDEVETQGSQGALLIEMARILEAGVGDRERAENAYRRLRMVSPEDLTAMVFYADWIDADEDPRRAYAVLSQCYGMLTPRDTCWERLSLARDMVRIATERLESPDKAIEAWRRVLTDAPEDEDANTALRALYTETERWHALAEHLDRWASGLADEEQREEKVALLFELASLYQDPDRLPMDELVASTYQRISLLSPANERALEHLASRFEEGEQWHELVSVLARKVEVTEDPGELIELFMKIAELYLERMRSDAEAIRVLELVLELDPENP
ncbi:MAG: hypothetical protein VX938_00825, partial [Myxococcota bacterium]|nr:hypothetical protein [Myxococcota bacterium]